MGVLEQRWGVQSSFSDPGEQVQVLRSWPKDVAGVGGAVRQLLVHYQAHGPMVTGPRLGQIDHRWVERILSAGRGGSEPVVGCCRDFALVTVAALRHAGIPARSRVGFASYLEPGFGTDHVVAEYWDGGRWVWADTQLDPDGRWGVDPLDLPRGGPVASAAFASAGQVWLAHRAGQVQASRYGVMPGLPMLTGGWLVRDYVWLELAHRMGSEVLLWDSWGAMGRDGDSALTDQVAGLLVAADEGEQAAEEELAAWFARDGRLNPGGWVFCASPSGYRGWVDLVARRSAPAV